MNSSKKAILLTVVIVLGVPLLVSAAWFWNKPAKIAATTSHSEVNEITQAEKDMADTKYKLWEEGFEKKNIESVIKNKDNFWLTTKEINYLFNKEGARATKPLLNNFILINNDDQLKVSANFKKIVSGQLSFETKVENSNNKIRLKLSKVKVYNIAMPAYFFSNQFNKELDKYFSFLYKDSRYQGFEFSNQNNILKLNLKFN